MFRKQNLTLALFLLLWAADLQAATITVTHTTMDHKVNGLFPLNGRCTLTEAIAAANTNTFQGDCPAGTGTSDTIILPTGTYTFTRGNSSTSDENALPSISTNITINGSGNAASETKLNRATYIPYSNNQYRFFKVVAGSLTLNNLQMQGGMGLQGAALLNQGGTVTLNNCVVADNDIYVPTTQQTSTNIATWRGGGIANLSGSTMSINGSTIRDNSGGGIYNTGTLSITNSTIKENTSHSYTPEGGGIYNTGTLTISNSFIKDNTTPLPSNENLITASCSTKGGGIYDNRASNLDFSISNSTLSGNEARCGGAIYFYGTAFGLPPTMQVVFPATTIQRVSFYNNTATLGYGGAIYHDRGNVTVKNSSFIENEAMGSSSALGSIAGTGGAIYKAASNTAQAPVPLQMINNTIVDNTSKFGGGGLKVHSNSSGTVYLKNTLIKGNHANSTALATRECQGPAISQGNNLFGPDFSTAQCSLSLQSTDKVMLPDLAGLILNTSQPAAIYYPLTVNSPAKNAGSNTGSTTEDQLGISKISTKDIGAIEYSCGDGQQSLHEVCDDGNADNTDNCTTLCAAPACGDGFVRAGNNEECDDGNTTTGDGCNNLCVTEECGDSIVQAGLNEQCDDGNTTLNDGCESCQLSTICGNGTVEDLEACDDGNTTNSDGCSAGCLVEECGDGIRQAALGEECDDGNEALDDGCDTECYAEVCGNGRVQSSQGEQCDDGNHNNNDGCNANCLNEFCGDGTLQPALAEACDDGNSNNDDGCNMGCHIEVCGDNVRQEALGEECDDGNSSDADNCVFNCQNADCGDGYLRTDGMPTETCDDGNTNNGDGCDNRCQTEANAQTTTPTIPAAPEETVTAPQEETVAELNASAETTEPTIITDPNATTTAPPASQESLTPDPTDVVTAPLNNPQTQPQTSLVDAESVPDSSTTTTTSTPEPAPEKDDTSSTAPADPFAMYQLPETTSDITASVLQTNTDTTTSTFDHATGLITNPDGTTRQILPGEELPDGSLYAPQQAVESTTQPQVRNDSPQSQNPNDSATITQPETGQFLADGTPNPDFVEAVENPLIIPQPNQSVVSPRTMTQGDSVPAATPAPAQTQALQNNPANVQSRDSATESPQALALSTPAATVNASASVLASENENSPETIESTPERHTNSRRDNHPESLEPNIELNAPQDTENTASPNDDENEFVEIDELEEEPTNMAANPTTNISGPGVTGPGNTSSLSEPAQAQSTGEATPVGGAKSGCQLSANTQASGENFILLAVLMIGLGVLRFKNKKLFL